MIKKEIVKRNLLAEPLSLNAMKLARGIYNTYLAMDEDLSLEIKLQNIFKLLNLQPCKDSINEIQDLLEEINEPLAVRNFEFEGESIQLKFVQFCTYEIGEETIKIELSPEYLHAQSEYMLDSFLF
ncbi:hypothetical protein [Sulfurimonas sp.]|jgi:hypothetical protein|uniref:hypothetical protein n=1 Tax=Sulfurimonas sp. TaxID=2022749 RepID=UPI002A36D18C|nr:hypothetical protein [Sulfurimonas sp.]MDY0122992.1 hypothetical protein [Sulfurimonas sp.]